MSRVMRNGLMFLACLALLLIARGLSPGEGRPRIVYKKNSLYHRIFVIRKGGIVSLRFGKVRGRIVQSRVDLGNLNRLMLEYTKLSFCGLLYNPEPERVLVVGLGGGVIPRHMRRYLPDLTIDIVEIDPEIPKVAARFFHFRPDERMKVHIADGRVFIGRLRRQGPVPKYDMVILDAYTSDYIPFHLMTKEFLEDVKAILSDRGVVVANVFHTNRLFDAELATFLAVFDRCQVFFGDTSTNAMLVAPGVAGATLTIEEATERAEWLQHKYHFSFDLRKAARRLRADAHPRGRSRVLTDDRAPVNRLRQQKRRGLP